MDATLIARHIAAELDIKTDSDDYLAILVRLEPVMHAANGMADALTAYFNKRGILQSQRAGNEDIADMADALAQWGDQEQLHIAGLSPAHQPGQ